MIPSYIKLQTRMPTAGCALHTVFTQMFHRPE